MQTWTWAKFPQQQPDTCKSRFQRAFSPPLCGKTFRPSVSTAGESVLVPKGMGTIRPLSQGPTTYWCEILTSYTSADTNQTGVKLTMSCPFKEKCWLGKWFPCSFSPETQVFKCLLGSWPRVSHSTSNARQKLDIISCPKSGLRTMLPRTKLPFT